MEFNVLFEECVVQQENINTLLVRGNVKYQV